MASEAALNIYTTEIEAHRTLAEPEYKAFR